jgi:hypothetical protein
MSRGASLRLLAAVLSVAAGATAVIVAILLLTRALG